MHKILASFMALMLMAPIAISQTTGEVVSSKLFCVNEDHARVFGATVAKEGLGEYTQTAIDPTVFCGEIPIDVEVVIGSFIFSVIGPDGTTVSFYEAYEPNGYGKVIVFSIGSVKLSQAYDL